MGLAYSGISQIKRILTLTFALVAILFFFCTAAPRTLYAAESGTPAKLAEVAKAEYKEVTGKYGTGAQSYSNEVRLSKKYVEFVEGAGASPEPWCADFVSYCLSKAGYTELYGAGKHAYHHDFVLDIVKSLAQGTVHKADSSYTPQVGDIVVRCSSSCGMDCGKGSTGQHVAIVCSVSADGSTFKTYGGNESNNICKKSYKTSSNTWDWFVTYGQVNEGSCEHSSVSNISACNWKGTRCKSCGAIDITLFCDGGIHDYKTREGKASTCAAAGYTAYKKCSECGAVSGKKALAKLAHTWGSWVHLQIASCTTDELDGHICTVCGAMATRALTEATGHDWSAWKVTKKATAKKCGKKTRTCKTCGEKSIKTIKATGKAHKHTFKKIKAKAATCTKSGYKAYKKCSTCGKKKGYKKIAAKGHSYSSAGVCTVCKAQR